MLSINLRTSGSIHGKPHIGPGSWSDGAPGALPAGPADYPQNLPDE